MTESTRIDPDATAELKAGFNEQPKVLPPKFFYDELGSSLFEEITELPEYYPTRTERGLLERWVPEWVSRLSPVSVIELGAGSAVKTRIILDATAASRPDATFVPVDISADFLQSTAQELRKEYPSLQIRPLVGDISRPLDIPAELPRPALIVFLGGTIGNFSEDEAIDLLTRAARWMTDADEFLIGLDLVKDANVLEAAYDDSQGVTARFNLNMLRVLNTMTGADFDPSRFSHLAFFDREKSRIEMHLVSKSHQRVTLPDGSFWDLDEGETIRTEISCKYERSSVERMMERAGLRIREWRTDEDDYYAIVRVGH
ncbi:L-histidine N(alpha)-methyltransferase [soil metagenome]